MQFEELVFRLSQAWENWNVSNLALSKSFLKTKHDRKCLKQIAKVISSVSLPFHFLSLRQLFTETPCIIFVL